MALYSDFAYFVAGLPPPIRKNGQKVIKVLKKRSICLKNVQKPENPFGVRVAKVHYRRF